MATRYNNRKIILSEQTLPTGKLLPGMIVTFNYSEQQLLGKFSSTIDIDMDKDLKLYIDLNQFSLFDKNTKERL